MRKNLWAALLLALCLTGLTGCDAISVMERQTYALCFAVDAAEEGGLTLSVQTPVNGSGDDPSATPEYSVFTATGATFEDAMAVLTATTPCTVNFCQLKLCVFGYELASRERLQPLLHKITTISTMRPNAMVAVALGRGEEVLHAIKPDFGMRLSTYLDIFMDRLEKAKLAPRHTVTCLLRDLDTEMKDPIIAVCAVNPALQEEAQPQGEGEKQQETQESRTVFARGNIEDEAFSVPGVLAGRMPQSGGIYRQRRYWGGPGQRPSGCGDHPDRAAAGQSRPAGGGLGRGAHPAAHLPWQAHPHGRGPQRRTHTKSSGDPAGVPLRRAGLWRGQRPVLCL